VVCGETDLDRLIEGRVRGTRPASTKVSAATRLTFNGSCSAHSTLLEVIAQDRPGLLHRISSILAEHGCNIEVALIDTEGQVAIDVFYLTAARAKLTPAHEERVREALLEELAE
jgi:[protein-PII] uridylyltransferase